MNKTRIETADYTWNPVVGCEHGCPYCYARPIAEKIYGSFKPQFLPERLKEPARVRKPSRIFVVSMGDLFGDWVPDEWIKAVQMAALGSHHTFQFLTKNPKRLKDFNPWPDNCWVGTTVTNQVDADERLPWLLQVEALVRFVSHEPVLGQTDVKPYLNLKKYRHGYDGKPFLARADFLGRPWIQWAIIGAMTGPGAVKVEPAWVVNLECQYQAAGVPIFEKNNLSYLCGPGAKLVQEFPK